MQPHTATQFQQRLLAGDWEGCLSLLPSLTTNEDVSKDVRWGPALRQIPGKGDGRAEVPACQLLAGAGLPALCKPCQGGSVHHGSWM